MHYGHFDEQSREYVITRPDTPRPWSNYLGSAEFGAVITNNAAGYTFYKSAAQGRLSRFRFNGPNTDMPGKYIYLRDQESGELWSNSWLPTAPPIENIDYECRFGPGYAKIRCGYQRISCESSYFIPLGKTFEVWHIVVTNNDSVGRSLRIFPFLEPQCNWNSTDDAHNLQYTQYISHTELIDGIIDIGSNINMPEDPDHFTNKDQARHCFFALADIEHAGYDADLEKFIGNYGSYASPAAPGSGKCGNSTATGDNPCAAFQLDLELKPGESRSFAVLFGVGTAAAAGQQARKIMSGAEKRLDELEKVSKHWLSRLDMLHAETPDDEFNAMVNTWAPFNNLMTFYWSRTASMVYAGERDGLGFRDTVQDIVGTAGIITEEAGERLELMLTGQLSNGGALPVVKPFDHHPGKESEPEHYRADDCLWFFNAVPEYVKETGDFDFYRKVLPYADCGEDPVYLHLRRAIEFNLERSGKHGLPCGLHADWNDCVRLGETGESIFVAFQLRLGMREYIEISERLGENKEAAWAREKLVELDNNLAEHAWDGEWFLRAYRFDGFKFGSRESDEGRIFMNPQTWAVLSGHAFGERANSVMAAMDRELATEYGIMLCSPPYINTDPKIALARLFNPGMKENGGIFNHTQGWAILAAAELGMNNKAWQYLKAVMPASFNNNAEIRQVEPYVVCQSTHSKESPRFGNGRVSWLSGSAVWNYYAMTHAILGIKPHYDGLEINPCIPDEWEGFQAVRQFRNRRFQIVVKRKSEITEISLSCNGEKIDGTVIPAAKFADNNAIVCSLPKLTV